MTDEQKTSASTTIGMWLMGRMVPILLEIGLVAVTFVVMPRLTAALGEIGPELSDLTLFFVDNYYVMGITVGVLGVGGLVAAEFARSPRMVRTILFVTSIVLFLTILSPFMTLVGIYDLLLNGL